MAQTGRQCFLPPTRRTHQRDMFCCSWPHYSWKLNGGQTQPGQIRGTLAQTLFSLNSEPLLPLVDSRFFLDRSCPCRPPAGVVERAIRRLRSAEMSNSPMLVDGRIILPQSSNGSWRERGGVREHRRKSGAASLCGFLPAAQLVVDSVVGPGSPQLSSWLVRASCTEVLQRPAESIFADRVERALARETVEVPLVLERLLRFLWFSAEVFK